MRRETREAVSLDSLLDVMMNVVGFLVVVLAVHQLHVAHQVSQTERSNIRDEIASIEDETSAIVDSIPDLQAELRDIEIRIQATEEPIESGPKLGVVADQWHQKSRRAEELAQQILAEERSAAASRQRIRQLEAQGATTQGRTEQLPPAAVVESYRSGDKGPKPAWIDMATIVFVCVRDRVFRIDDKILQERLTSGVRRATSRGIKRQTLETWQKAVEYFESHDVGDQFIRLKLTSQGGLRYEFRAGDIGESMADIDGGQSQYETFLRVGVAEDEAWVMFYVWDNSFAAYTRARSIAVREGFRVGWLPYAADQILASGSGGGGGEGRIYGPER